MYNVAKINKQKIVITKCIISSCTYFY